MIQNEGLRMLVNRVMAFLMGALLVLIIMSVTVVSKIKDENGRLAKELDASQYEPARLLADAQAQFTSGEFEKVKQTLNVLFERRPGSSEATKGKVLYGNAVAAIASDNAKWEASVAGIRERWAKEMTAQLRGKSEAARLEMEKTLDETLSREWEKMKDQVRREWTKAQG